MKTALVIDLNYMGDMLMSSPVYRALSEQGYEVDAMIWPEGKEALRGNPYVRKIFQVDNMFTEFVTAWSDCHMSHYDLALHLSTSRWCSFLVWLTGAKLRLAYSYLNNAWPWCNIRIPKETRCFQSQYRVDEVCNLLWEGLKIHVNNRKMIFESTSEVPFSLKEFEKPYIGFHVNPARTRGQRWWNSWAWLGDFLIREHKVGTIFFTGVAEDTPYIESIINQMGYKSQAVNVAGLTSLSELAALIKKCSLFCSVNSGPMHLAISQGVPTFGIIGATPARVVFPVNDPKHSYIEI